MFWLQAVTHGPFRSLENGIEKSAVNSDSLENGRKSGELPPPVSRLHLTPNSSYFSIHLHFLELHDTFFSQISFFPWTILQPGHPFTHS